MFNGGWITDNVPYRKPCVVLTNPSNDKQCGNPALPDQTILDLPICEACYSAVRAISERPQRAA